MFPFMARKSKLGALFTTCACFHNHHMVVIRLFKDLAASSAYTFVWCSGVLPEVSGIYVPVLTFSQGHILKYVGEFLYVAHWPSKHPNGIIAT